MKVPSWYELSTRYDHLTLHIVPGPRSFSYSLPFILLPISLSIPPSVVSIGQIRYYLLPTILLVQFHVWSKYPSFDVLSMNNCLVVFMLLGWYDVRRDFNHVRWRTGLTNSEPHHQTPASVEAEVQERNNAERQTHSERCVVSEAYPNRLGLRWKWLGLLCTSLRLTDWRIGMASHDAQQPSSFDYFDSVYLNVMVHAALSQFGSFSSIYTAPLNKRSTFGLRAFWGVFWHQNMRHMTSVPGIAFAAWIGLPRGSVARYMAIVTSSFFWSGVVHMGVIPPEPINSHMSVVQLRVRLASFFWLQIIGVALEVMYQNAMFPTVSAESQKTPIRDGKAKKASGPVKTNHAHKLSDLLWSTMALIWTASFLAMTAWWTIYPVGCAMDWWQLGVVPRTAQSILTRISHRLS